MATVSSFPKLVLATRNIHKARELKSSLDSLSVEIIDLSAFPDAPAVDETADTLKENAALKALSAHKHTGVWALGDDTGLYIHALDGLPGVRSARFAGENSDAKSNRRLVLELLSNKPDRTAHFSTVLALARSDGLHYFEGRMKGRIALTEQSNEGFGYESIFIPDGYEISLAQLSVEEKNQISHRSNSAMKLIEFLGRPYSK